MSVKEMNVAIFACPYSANLGDGLLTLCLAKEMEKSQPGLSVIIQDLAGRTDYGEGGQRRKAALGLLHRIPKGARASVMALMLGSEVARKLRPGWAKALSRADAAVLGGGNLLADVDLNFPLKIAGLGEELKQRGIPWAVFGVGASAAWTQRGSELFESALLAPAITHVAVRDLRSKAIWHEKLTKKGALEAKVCRDPAILTCDHFPAKRRASREHPVLGLNITAPEELSMHSDLTLATGDSVLEWWLALITQTVEAGYEVRLFTNGSLQDTKYLQRLEHILKKSQTSVSRLSFLPRPRKPDELATIIADCDVLAGHRLHAHIPAFSYRIPSVGFAWDLKVRSFFESVNRSQFVLDASKTPVADVLQCIFQAHSTGVCEETWRAATACARRDIATMVDSFANKVVEKDLRGGALYA
jgi:polysaccharide pyruvyl transferase WcaK-like protein